jgi:hypothetical protein
MDDLAVARRLSNVRMLSVTAGSAAVTYDRPWPSSTEYMIVNQRKNSDQKNNCCTQFTTS